MEKIENIKNLYKNEIHNENRADLIEKISIEFNVATSSVRTGWFSRYEIPSRYNLQDQLIVFMQNYIANQPEPKTVE